MQESEYCDPILAMCFSSKTIQVFQVPMGHDEKLKEFDPYEMSVEKPTTLICEHPYTNCTKETGVITYDSIDSRYAETMVNFVKQNLGTGILALPNAIYHGGYLLGPICMIAVFVFSIYCKHMLVSIFDNHKLHPCHQLLVKGACQN
ncbi:hypothetical protein PR048_004276 [Dryococelus australis]|uniref:Amino acid transporter transmembrane domain-containing protein n=1 Tax=Dryococelus australis TaxID=614101 RepID=A0ABQ9I5V6_9NEOP|nr:hypothetical protein PR048_004276 [Dryococelus australis]